MPGRRREPGVEAAVEPEMLAELVNQGVVRRTFVRLNPERRHAVTAAALAAASESGVEGLSIKEVARRAQVPVGSLYQYFGNRTALLRFVCVLAARALTDDLDRYAPALAEMPLQDGLRTYLTEAIAWGRRQPILLRLQAVAAYGLALRTASSAAARAVASSRPDADREIIQPIAATMRRLVGGLLEAARRRGELRDGLDVEAAVGVINTTLLAVIDAALVPGLNEYYRLYPGQRSVDGERVREEAISMLAHAVLRDPSR